MLRTYPSYRAPDSFLRVNKSDPLTSGLQSAWVFQRGANSLTNLLQGGPSLALSGTISNTPLGLNGAASTGKATASAQIAYGSTLSVMAVVQWGSDVATFQDIVDRTENNQLAEVFLQSGTNNISWRVRDDAGGGLTGVAGPNPVAFHEYVILGTYDTGVGEKLYVNGTLVGSNANTGFGPYSITHTINNHQSNAQPFLGVTKAVYTWNRALSYGEARTLWRFPYSFVNRSFKLLERPRISTPIFYVGTAPGDSTASGVGAPLGKGVGSAPGDSTASGVGASLNNGVGTAPGDSTASGAGASLNITAGTAPGDSTSSGVGAGLGAGVGTAPGDSTANSVGAALGKGVGSAPGDSTASGVGAGLGAGVGTAPGDSTASGVGTGLGRGVGNAPGDSTASGVSVAIKLAVGTAPGDSTASGAGSNGTAIPTNTFLDTLLLAAQDKLIDDGLFNDSTIFLAVRPEAALKFPPSDQFAVISPGPQTVDEHIRIGGGRSIMVVDGTMTLTLWCRLALDQVPRGDSWLTDGTFGALPPVQCIVNSLELYQPLDVMGNQLMPMGFKLKSIDVYSRDEAGVGFGAIRTTWNMCWSLDLRCV